jgi:hypothetical protein
MDFINKKEMLLEVLVTSIVALIIVVIVTITMVFAIPD